MTLSAFYAPRLRRLAGANLAFAGILLFSPFDTAAAQASSGSGAQSGSQTGSQTTAPGTAPLRPGVLGAQIPTAAGPVYNDKYEIYGGLSFMNGQAGQNLPKRYNMGGGEVMATYWLGKYSVRKLGITADYRLEAGTTPVLSPYYNRVLVYQNIAAGGLEYRGPRNRYAAVDFHALAGFAHGTFDNAIKNYPGGSPVAACQQQQTGSQQGNVGLYCNSSTPWGAAGGSIDFNYAPRVGIRLSPDMIFEHYGTELREYFSISGGVLYRFGRR